MVIGRGDALQVLHPRAAWPGLLDLRSAAASIGVVGGEDHPALGGQHLSPGRLDRCSGLTGLALNAAVHLTVAPGADIETL